MESGFIEVKLDCSGNDHAAGEAAVAQAALSSNCDLFRRCSLSDGADVSFLVGGYKFYAHRAVLAAGSPVFRDFLLFGPTAAAASMDGIRVDGVDPETFRVLLRFMYTGNVGEIEAASTRTTAEMLLRNLVAAADTYGMERLKLACARKLCEHVSAETVVAALDLAETHGCPELRKKCVDFLTDRKNNNLHKALLSHEYVQLMLRFPSVLDEIRARVFQGLDSSDYDADFCISDLECP